MHGARRASSVGGRFLGSIRSDPTADAVVGPGGGYDVRPVVAADLYKKGLVHKILVSRVAVEDGTKPDSAPNQIDSKVLQDLGVPEM
jgi:hypothetical protein